MQLALQQAVVAAEGLRPPLPSASLRQDAELLEGPGLWCKRRLLRSSRVFLSGEEDGIWRESGDSVQADRDSKGTCTPRGGKGGGQARMRFQLPWELGLTLAPSEILPTGNLGPSGTEQPPDFIATADEMKKIFQVLQAPSAVSMPVALAPMVPGRPVTASAPALARSPTATKKSQSSCTGSEAPSIWTATSTYRGW